MAISPEVSAARTLRARDSRRRRTNTVGPIQGYQRNQPRVWLLSADGRVYRRKETIPFALKKPLTRNIHRDREEPHDPSPPTPPDIRVTYPAVRWIESAVGAPMEARSAQPVDVAPG